MIFTIHSRPATAKNGMSVVRLRNGRTISIKKKSLVNFEREALAQIPKSARINIGRPVNVRMRFWIKENRRTDLVGLEQAVLDILVKAGVIKDDSGWHERIAVSYDGSIICGVDPKHPRVEIVITPIV